MQDVFLHEVDIISTSIPQYLHHLHYMLILFFHLLYLARCQSDSELRPQGQEAQADIHRLSRDQSARSAGPVPAISEPNWESSCMNEDRFYTAYHDTLSRRTTRTSSRILLPPHDSDIPCAWQHYPIGHPGGSDPHKIQHHIAAYPLGHGCRPCGCQTHDIGRRESSP